MALPCEGVGAGTGPVPDWMSDCELNVCRALHEASSQISAQCRLFGSTLQGVCGTASEKLPADKDGGALSDCSDFLSAFGLLSHTLTQLAGDLETTVTLPLQSAILTLNEESVGRVKHWRQVRGRLIELQDRYSKKKKLTGEARGRLAKAESVWFGKQKNAEEKAAEQHAAMCELARCEEDLVASEASLRSFEHESRDRLRQLDREKQVLLRGVLRKGRCLLRQLVTVAEKAAPPASHRSTSPEPRSVEAQTLHGVMPPSLGAADKHEEEAKPVDDLVETSSPESQSPAQIVPADRGSGDAAQKEADEQEAAAANPASKYLPGGGHGSRAVEVEYQELAELDETIENEYEDTLSRSMSWTPSKARLPARSPGVVRAVSSSALGASAARRPFVFQDKDPFLVANASSSTERDAAYAKQASDGARSGLPAASTSAAAASPASSLRSLATSPVAQIAIAQNAASPAASSPMTKLWSPPPREGSASWPLESASACASANAATPTREAAAVRPAPVASLSGDIDDDDALFELSLEKTEKPAVPLPLDMEVGLELTPLVTPEPRKAFEQYVRRIPERLACAMETSWEKMQGRSAENIPGGHIGKLEMFWITRSGSEASADEALGLVCFQFVQGFASNFARVLHLSVTGSDRGGANDWREMLPHAVLEVRRLLFTTLPVGSIRSVILAGEDAEKRIYVDRDVEVAYQRCSFRWFQLTQSLKHTKATITRRASVKPKSRFLVLNAMRRADDPSAPRNSSISSKPALLLRSEPNALTGDDVLDAAHAAAAAAISEGTGTSATAGSDMGTAGAGYAFSDW